MCGGHARGASARRRAAWLTGELAAARTSVWGAGCIRCNESGWWPGQVRGAPDDAEVRRVPRSCEARRRRFLGQVMVHVMQPAGPGCIAMPAGAMMMQAAQRNQLHHRCIRSRRSVKAQVTAAARRSGTPSVPQGRTLRRRQRVFTQTGE